MLVRFRRVRDALANRFEDFRFSQVRYEQSEQMRPIAGGIRLPYVCAGSSDTVDEADILQFPNRAAHRDARSAGPVDKRGLARQLLSRPKTAGDDIALQRFEKLLVFGLDHE